MRCAGDICLSAELLLTVRLGRGWETTQISKPKPFLFHAAKGAEMIFFSLCF